ncbi:Mediator of RNA polymerase II transcription subunit 1 [Trachymyrmex zeteki]|uniref:XK-related protein n=1 Tax=Mycetomoellerius zeteki TaxID=64791 RepID=A0A151XJR6_9HYME|nr:Mediator of RNA polymerase II transcription subunit 1 [Trachymyrmex zeteki]
MHNINRERSNVTWVALALQAAWRSGMLISRFIVLILALIFLKAWFFLFLGLHWLFMTIWVILQKTKFCSTAWEERIYNCVIGLIYCFDFFNLRDDRSRYRVLIFYSVIVAQNVVFLIIYMLDVGETIANITMIMIASVIVGCMLIGLTSMSLYYGKFHPSRTATNISRNISEHSTTTKVDASRSFKLFHRDSLVSLHHSMDISPRTEEVPTDKQSLLTNIAQISDCVEEGIVNRNYCSENESNASALRLSTECERPHSRVGVKHKEEVTSVNDNPDNTLTSSPLNSLYSGLPDIDSSRKRRGIYEHDITPQLDWHAPDILNIDLDQLGSLDNSERSNSLTLDSCSKVIGALDVIKNREKLTTPTPLESSRIFDIEKQRDETMSCVTSIHDYENVCPLGIARPPWCIRSWKGYTDIETYIHDDSVVRDRRRDTLTSTTGTTYSSEYSDGMISRGILKQDDYADALTYDLVESKGNKSSYSDSTFSTSADDQNASLYIAKPVVFDDRGGMLALDTILEERDDLSSSDEKFQHGTELSRDSASTLVSTIDQIRRYTADNSPRHIYHTTGTQWEDLNPKNLMAQARFAKVLFDNDLRNASTTTGSIDLTARDVEKREIDAIREFVRCCAIESIKKTPLIDAVLSDSPILDKASKLMRQVTFVDCKNDFDTNESDLYVEMSPLVSVENGENLCQARPIDAKTAEAESDTLKRNTLPTISKKSPNKENLSPSLSNNNRRINNIYDDRDNNDSHAWTIERDEKNDKSLCNMRFNLKEKRHLFLEQVLSPVPKLWNKLGQPSPGGGSASDKGKEWQMEFLMEKLRSKSSTYKSLVETAKNMRMAMLDKRFAIDSIEKNQLQKCLDTLQHSIKVTSFQSMVERLESLARQLGLKFMMSGPPGTEIFISSDMFFLEVLLEPPSGLVRDVKIHHEGKSEQQSCEALASALSRGDFVDFTTQLEGLASIYQLNADKKVKCKAFSALQSLEADLGVLAQLQTFMKEPFNLVHKSPVGILERRRGGHPMKLTYFVSPYDLIDEENRTYDTLNPDTIIKRKIGHSVTVCMEGSTGHKLPTSSIITVNRSPTGKSTPSYASLTSTNSSMLPACFVLKLVKKMPICMELMKKIQKVTELECGDISAPHPLLSLIIQHASDGQLDCRNNRGLYVTLPDQQHCYFMTENKNMEGVLVCSIPFTHPAHVPQILVYLRQQALFNCLIASCVRPMARQDPEHTTILEVSALSWQHISVSVEHPYEETMATVELDLTDISTLKCRLYGVSMTTNVEQTSDLSGRVLQRCLSIPLTMRMLLKIWEGRSLPAVMNSLTSGSGSSNGSYNLNLGSGANNTSASMLNPLQLGALLGQAKNSLTSNSNTNERGKKARKRKTGTDGLWRSPKRKSDGGDSSAATEILLESSSSENSTPLGTPTNRENLASETRTSTPTSATSLTSGMDFTNLDTTDILDKSTSDYDLDNSEKDSEIMEVQHSSAEQQQQQQQQPQQEVEELIKIRESSSTRKSKKNRSGGGSEEKKSSPTNIFVDETSTTSSGNKGLPVPPSVSITPISCGNLDQASTTNYNSVLTGMGLERRPGIEIIPIASSPSQTNLPSSITITPIAGPAPSPKTSGLTSATEDRQRSERKSGGGKSSSSSSKSSSEDTKSSGSKLEKRRKRKREDGPMGPPDKVPSGGKQQQDPLSKPVSVSIKPSTEQSPPSGGSAGVGLSCSSSRPTSPAAVRKFSPSPTHSSSLATLVGKSSPTLKASQSAAATCGKPVQSPKHSPVYGSTVSVPVPVPAGASPKHGSTSSPKHGSSAASSGKPSMSALKSAAPTQQRLHPKSSLLRRPRVRIPPVVEIKTDERHPSAHLAVQVVAIRVPRPSPPAVK